MTNPTEPTLTCSEVVERLAVECFVLHHVNEPDRFDRAQAEKILTEWREQIRKGAKHE